MSRRIPVFQVEGGGEGAGVSKVQRRGERCLRVNRG